MLRRLILFVVVLLLVGCGSEEYNKDTKLERMRTDASIGLGRREYTTKSVFYDKVDNFLQKYIEENSFAMDEATLKNYKNCIYYNIWKKSQDMSLSIPLQVCDNEFKNNTLMNTEYGNPTYIMANRSQWNGENELAKKAIVKSLRAPDTYEFKESSYGIRNNGKQIAVRTNYTAKNAFGVPLQQSVYILFDEFGNILYVEQN